MNKNKNKKLIIVSMLSIITISSIGLIYYNQKPKEEPIIAAYINGNLSSTLPTKGGGYMVEKIVCDNNNSASWDYDKWGIKLSNWSTRSRCNIYFKSLESFSLANKTFYLDEMQRCPSMNDDGTVTVTGMEDTYGYLCKAKDAYGTSYYYRGNVTNNYVLFAGKYWRIVRYNGDGTVRVIYDGTSAHANGESSTDRQIGTTAFNNSMQDNSNIGYMYGISDNVVETSTSTEWYPSTYTNTNYYYLAKEYIYNESSGWFSLNTNSKIKVSGEGMTNSYIGYYTFNDTTYWNSRNHIYKITSVTPGSSGAKVGYSYVIYGTTSKEKAQTNTNSSAIKTYLDTWYENNIKGTASEQYVADNIFCNDRSLSSNIPNGYSNKGYGAEKTAYRWYSDASSKIMLTCPQKNDAFTVNDTLKGNGALIYGIGLLNADELTLAGSYKYNGNQDYYLYNGQNYWLITPASLGETYRQASANGRHVDSYGGMSTKTIGNILGARPVINLTSDILKNGDGTASNPYHV